MTDNNVENNDFELNRRDTTNPLNQGDDIDGQVPDLYPFRQAVLAAWLECSPRELTASPYAEENRFFRNMQTLYSGMTNEEVQRRVDRVRYMLLIIDIALFDARTYRDLILLCNLKFAQQEDSIEKMSFVEALQNPDFVITPGHIESAGRYVRGLWDWDYEQRDTIVKLFTELNSTNIETIRYVQAWNRQPITDTRTSYYHGDAEYIVMIEDEADAAAQAYLDSYFEEFVEKPIGEEITMQVVDRDYWMELSKGERTRAELATSMSAHEENEVTVEEVYDLLTAEVALIGAPYALTQKKEGSVMHPILSIDALMDADAEWEAIDDPDQKYLIYKVG